MWAIGALTFFAAGCAAAIVCASSSCCQFIAILAGSVGKMRPLLALKCVPRVPDRLFCLARLALIKPSY